MAQNLKQLGQLRPANTTAASIYSPAAATETVVKSIIVCNVSANDLAFSIFHDDDGTTYDEGTALFWDIELLKEKTVVLEFNLMMNDENGNLAVETTSANDINFTCYGSEVT